MKKTAYNIAKRILDQGHQAYFVGGGVRDSLLGLPVKDVDIATSATPNQIQKIFPGSNLVGVSFGVVIVKSGSFQFEITTFRKDGKTADGRRPESITFGSLEDDSNRRDFTINCLYQHPETEEIVDLHGGINDINKKVIKCIGDPNSRFEEDFLRMLRAIRFAARFNFEIEKETLKAIKENCTSISKISAERIRTEITQMITGPHPGLALDFLKETCLLQEILPEVSNLIGIPQNPKFHPEGDCFKHTKLILENLQPRVNLNAWACLLHDIGKVKTTTEEDGSIHAYQHHEIGADMADIILERLRFSNKEKELITRAVYDHMKPFIINEMKRSKMRRFFSCDHFDIVLSLHKADCLASNGNLENYHCILEKLEEFKNEPIIPPPLISGRDLINLGLSPGPIFSKILNKIQAMQLEGTIMTKEDAIKKAKMVIKGEQE